MNRYCYKVLKLMLKYPSITVTDISNLMKLPITDMNEILETLERYDYAVIYIDGTYEVNFLGKIFKQDYYRNIFQSIFKTYIFQIILTLISFGLGLLSGLLLK